MHNLTYGTATKGDIEGKTGLEVLQAMIEQRLPAPTISRQLTFWLSAVQEGEAIFEGEPSADYLNPMGTVHGGWALTLIDSACGCAAMTTLGIGQSYTTLETKGNMTRPILPSTGKVRCIGKVISKGQRVITAEAVITDVKERILAHGTSTLLVL